MLAFEVEHLAAAELQAAGGRKTFEDFVVVNFPKRNMRIVLWTNHHHQIKSDHDGHVLYIGKRLRQEILTKYRDQVERLVRSR